MRALMLLATLVAAVLPAVAAPGEFQVRVRSVSGTPVALHGPAVPLWRLLRLKGKPESYRLRVFEGERELPAQLEMRAGEASFIWQPTAAPTATAARRFTLRLQPGTLAAKSPVAVQESPASVTVQTPFLRIVHPRDGNGGLPTTITFLPENRTFDHFSLNDRLYGNQRGYALRNDRKPEVTVEFAGPVQLVVRVRARYCDEAGNTPESAPAAVYRFIYYAGLPLFRVEATVSQRQVASWEQLHFLEWNFHHDFFSHWVAADSADAVPAAQAFAATKKSQHAAAWGALLNDSVALAQSSGGELLYDDKDGYGRYLHGAWVNNWDGQPRALTATIYAGPASLDPAVLSQKVAPNFTAATRGMALSVPALEERLARAARKKHGGALERWLLRLATSDARQMETLADAAALLDSLEKAPAQRTRTAAGAVQVRELPGLVLATDGVLGLGFKKEGSGWRLRSIANLKTGHDFLGNAGTVSAIWQAQVRRADGKTIDSFTGGPAQLKLDRAQLPRQLTMRLSWPGEVPVTATIVLRAGSGLSTWRAAAGAPKGGRSLWRFDFPALSGLGSREDPSGDTVAVPRSWGILHHAPAPGFSAGATYPSGSWSMQYALLLHGDTGLYLAEQDPHACVKEFAFNRLSEAEGGGITYWVQHPAPDMGKPGVGYASPCDTVIGVYQGDWYEGSRIYRRWALTAPWAEKGPLAKRKDSAAIHPLSLWLLLSGTAAQVVPQAERMQDFFGVPIGLHWYNWHEIPFDDDYPHYFPTKPGFKEGVAALTKRGIAVMPYINGRLWDTDTTDWPAAKPASAMRSDGENYVEVYGSKQKLAPMCPTTALWQRTMKETVLRLVREEGVSGVYLDQITAAAPAICFNPAHGHPLGGGDYWWRGYRELLGTLRAELAKSNPNAFLTSENNAEPWMDSLDGHLTWMPPLGNMAPLYTAVYGGYTYPFGRATQRDTLEDGNAAAMIFATQFLWGGQLGWLGPEIMEPKYRPLAEYLRLLAQARAQYLPYLAEGEMLKAPKLLTHVPNLTARTNDYSGPVPDEMPAVLTAAWRALDGSVAFFLTNLSPTAQQFDWEIDFAAHRLGKTALLAVPGTREELRVSGPRLHRAETLPGYGLRVLIARPAH